MESCPLGPRSGITSAAGLLTCGSTLFGAFPHLLTGTVTGYRHAEELPNYSGGPVPESHRLSYSSRCNPWPKPKIEPGHRTLFCFRWQDYVMTDGKSTGPDPISKSLVCPGRSRLRPVHLPDKDYFSGPLEQLSRWIRAASLEPKPLEMRDLGSLISEQ